MLGSDAADGLALLLLEMHGHGYLVAEVFFGLWLFPLGYVVHRSGFIPRILGIGLMIGCVGYLGAFLATVTAPGFESSVAPWLAWPAAIAELGLLGACRPPRGQPKP